MSLITETQIVKAIQEYEGGGEQTDICRELGSLQPSYFLLLVCQSSGSFLW